MRQALLLLVGLAPFLVNGQSIPVNGVLTVHNSAYQTGRTMHVEGASVRAEQARPVTFDALWYGYLLKEQERTLDEKVDALLCCRAERRQEFHGSPAQERITWEALRNVAAATGRSRELTGHGPIHVQR